MSEQPKVVAGTNPSPPSKLPEGHTVIKKKSSDIKKGSNVFKKHPVASIITSVVAALGLAVAGSYSIFKAPRSSQSTDYIIKLGDNASTTPDPGHTTSHQVQKRNELYAFRKEINIQGSYKKKGDVWEITLINVAADSTTLVYPVSVIPETIQTTQFGDEYKVSFSVRVTISGEERIYSVQDAAASDGVISGVGK